MPGERVEAQSLVMGTINSWKRKPREGPGGKVTIKGEYLMAQEKRKLNCEHERGEEGNGDRKRRVLGNLNNQAAEADV